MSDIAVGAGQRSSQYPRNSAPTPGAAAPAGPSDSVELSPAAQAAINEPQQWSADDQHISQVSHMSDPAARNREITQDYTHIGNRLHHMMGDDGGANWSTFASFASSRAGETIRGEDKPGLGKFGETALSFLSPAAIPAMQTRDAAYQQSQQAVGDGNRNVYQDIAPQLQRFADTFEGDKAPNQKKWDEFSKGFGADQGEIKDGLHEYYQGMFDKDEHSKQEHILHGNLLLAQREQQRLDPTIKAAMPGCSGDGWTNGIAKHLMTDHITLPLPGENLSLSSDVPSFQGQEAPAPLHHIDDPGLAQQIQRWGGNAGDNGYLKGTGASNWANLGDRMRFISGLMRSRQDDPALYQVTPR
ncbi:MAG TPA: hypothetical protein VGO93_25570 [Candidatus Xenobia bacterium]